MIRDLQSGFRQFLTKPLFCALAVLLLAIGIGANVLIFGFVDTLLLKPLPVHDADNLWVMEGVRQKQIGPSYSFTYGQFEELEKHTNLFSGVTAEQDWGGTSAYPSDEAGNLQMVMTQILAPNYFTELGVKPELGRLLTESDTNLPASIPAVISYQFWLARYGGRSDVVGKTIRIKKYPFTIVGVLPQDFHSLDIERAPDVRLPISAAPILEGQPVDDPRGSVPRQAYRILVRLRPGVFAGSIEQALGETLRRELEAEFLLRNASLNPPLPASVVDYDLRWIHDEHLVLEPAGRGISRLRTQFARALQILMSGVVVLLISVCANVAGLLLARGEERRKELAVRLSIGAGHWRMLRQLMCENLCLAIPGALLGILLAYLLAPWLLHILPPVRSLDQYASPQILTATPNLRVLLFAWLALIVSICFFGLFPAWRGSRLDLNAELKGTSTIEAHSVAALIPVTVQIALSVLLLAASGLMLHSYWNLENLNPGFDRMHVLSFTLGIKDANFTPEQTSSYMAELLHRVEQLPGIRAAAFSNHGVMRGAGVKTIVTTPGVNQPASVYLNTTVVSVSPTYFETLGIPLLSGRVLEPFDSQMRPKPIVINRALASLLFPHVNPIGKFLVQGADGTKAPTAIIVGMVETAKFRTMQESATPTYYSLLTDEDYQLVLYLRTIGDPSSLIRPAEDAIRASASGVPLIEMAPLEQEVQNSLWQERLVARLASFFSVIALLLAGIGLYGTLAYSVSRRKRELGIRLAIGARVRDIIGTVCGRMTWAVAIGLATGLAIATVTLRLARAFLFGVEPIDQLSFAAATAAVLLCSALAALFPSWLAIRTDPAAALREE